MQEPSRVESALFKARGEGASIVIPGHKVRVDPHLSIDYVECEHLSQTLVHYLRIHWKFECFEEGHKDDNLHDFDHAPQTTHRDGEDKVYKEV